MFALLSPSVPFSARLLFGTDTKVCVVGDGEGNVVSGTATQPSLFPLARLPWLAEIMMSERHRWRNRDA